MKKVKIEQLNLGSFIELIESISKVDKFISLKIEPESIKSTVYFPEKDAVKVLSIPTEQMFAEVKGLDESFKMCFFNGEVINSILKRFVGPGKVSAEIAVEGDDLAAKSLLVYNSDLRIKITCSDPASGFTELKDDIIERVFDTSAASFEFDLESSQKSKFEDLTKIDPDRLTFSVSTNDEGVYLSGTSYQYQVSERGGDNENEVHLFKKFLNVLDKDDYTVKVSDERTFFESQQRDVRIVFSNCAE